jgi:hypothetical protein
MYKRLRYARVITLLLLYACGKDPETSEPPAPVPHGTSQALAPAITATSVNASTTDRYYLPGHNTVDWAHWGSQGFVRNSNGSQISDVTPLGGTCGTSTAATRHAAWKGGTPTTDANDDGGYYWCKGVTGQGWSFSAPAGTIPRTLSVYWGGSASDNTNVKLVAHLDDGSAPDLVVTKTNTAAVNMYVTTISYRASRATTLRVTLTKNDATASTSVDLKAAWLSSVSTPNTTVTFEELSNGARLSRYGGISWGTGSGGWKVWDGGTSFTRNAYVDSRSTSEVTTTFTLPPGQVLRGLKAGTVSRRYFTVKFSSPGNPEAVFALGGLNGASHFGVGLGWSVPAATITVKITCGGEWGASDVVFDDFVYGPPPLPPISDDTTVTFEELGDGDALSTHAGIGWGGSGAAWKVSHGGLLTLHGYVDSRTTSEVVTTLTLPAGQMLKSLKLAASAPATIKVSSAGNPEHVWSDLGTSYQVKTLDWTTASPTVTVKVTGSGQWGASDLSFDDIVYGPVAESEPPHPEDGVVWEPISVSDARVQRDAFRWDQTTALSETSTRSYDVGGELIALPPMHYVQIYVRSPDHLRELEEMGIHYDLAPLFDSEWPESSSSLVLPFQGDSEDSGGQFAFALIPSPVYNALRAEALAGEETYRAVILRSLPADARAADGTVSWDFILANMGSYAPSAGELTDEGEIVPPLDDADAGVTSTTQKRLGKRLRNVVRKVANATRALVDGTRRAIGAAANLVTRETVLHIHTRVDRRNFVPLVRSWDDGKGGFGKPLTLHGVRVNVSGQSRLTLYKKTLDENGEAVVAVPRSLRVNICFEADSPTAKFESGILRPVLHCWPKHTPRGDADHIPPRDANGAIQTKAVGDTEFYTMAQLIDSREYAKTVLGFQPPKATVQVGPWGEVLTKGTPAFVPCLAATRAPVSLVNTYVTALNLAGGAAHGIGDALEFILSTDIVIGHEARKSRNTPVHEYGHFVFCTLLDQTRMATFSRVWSQVLTFKNLDDGGSTEVKALNEGFADWFASQVGGGVNYFSPPDNEAEFGIKMVFDEDLGVLVPKKVGQRFVGFEAPAKGQGLEANIGGPACPSGASPADVAATACLDATGWKAESRVVGTVASLLHDAIDRSDCGGDAVCKSQLRGDAALWDIFFRPFRLKPFALDHAGDEKIALSPRDIADAVREFANQNHAEGTSLSYENFYRALAGKMTERSYTYYDICNLFALHGVRNFCSYNAGPTFLKVGFSARPSEGGSVTGNSFGSNTCGADTCWVIPGREALLEATPAPGFRFKEWTGCATTTVVSTLHLRDVTTDLSCVANFEEIAPSVTVAFNANTGGQVVGRATGGTCTPSACTFPAGSSVTLTATPHTGFRFSAWSGCSTQSGTALSLNAVQTSQSCQAVFTPITYTITTRPTVGGSAAISASTVNHGASVTLTATPDPGFRFVNYSGNARCTGANPVLTIASVTSNITCNVNFAAIMYTVSASASAGGRVTPTNTSVAHGNGVSLTATADPNYRFVNFSGSPQCTGTNPSLTIVPVTSNVACVANFARTGYEVRATASAGGTVTPSFTTVVPGGGVQLVATPNAGSSFAGYTGSPQCTGTNRTLTLSSVQSDISCVANFGTIQQVTVTFGASNPIGGSVGASGAPAGACGASSCTFNNGGSVTLTAQPSAGYKFGYWSGCSNQTGASLALNVVTSNQTCTATFLKTWQVTYTADWPGLPSASVVGGAACTGSVCTVLPAAGVSLVGDSSSQTHYVDRWTCTESGTGRVVSSAGTPDPSRFTLSSIQNNWSCRATTSPFVQ